MASPTDLRGDGAVAPGGERPRAADDASIGELFADLGREMSTLVSQELALAKAELREEASKAASAAGMLGGAALAAYLTLLFLSFAAAWGLAAVLPRGVAFLLVGVVHLILAGALFVLGRARLSKVRPVPDETIDTVKEDVQWARAQLR